MFFIGKRLKSTLVASHLCISLDDFPLYQISSHTVLRLSLTNYLLTNIMKLQGIGILRKIKAYLPLQERKLTHVAAIKPTLMYGGRI